TDHREKAQPDERCRDRKTYEHELRLARQSFQKLFHSGSTLRHVVGCSRTPSLFVRDRRDQRLSEVKTQASRRAIVLIAAHAPWTINTANHQTIATPRLPTPRERGRKRPSRYRVRRSRQDEYRTRRK